MGSEEDRLDKLETAVRSTQDSILLMGKDIHTLTQTMQSIANSMDALVTLQQDIKLADQRNENRHDQLKDADKTIHMRLDGLSSRISVIEQKCEVNTEEILKRSKLEDRFFIVEDNVKKLELIILLTQYPKAAMLVIAGLLYMFAKDVRDLLFQAMGAM